MQRTFTIERFNPEKDARAHMQRVTLECADARTVLDALELLAAQDATLAFRRSTRDGACGADAMRINGRPALASHTLLYRLPDAVELRPLPGFRVIRDLVVDLSAFWAALESVQPWMEDGGAPLPVQGRRQGQDGRAALDGLLECTLCACCTAACPSWRRNPDRFAGPAALLHVARFVADSRDAAHEQRLDDVDDARRLFACRSAMSCTAVCPQGLNPAAAISALRVRLARRDI